MGGGAWTTSSFRSYAKTKGASVSASGAMVGLDSVQDNFTQHSIAEELNPMNVMRECLDTPEHPNTIPVILGLDVTGSMGIAGFEVAKKIGVIMTDLYSKYKDIEFCVMGIGDLAYDHAPVQISQFESDIRIAEHIDKVYMERGGGGNGFESYTAAWYFGLKHTKLDCWKRGQKGIIITTGDECLNPYLPQKGLERSCGDTPETAIETDALYSKVIEKFDVFHISIDDKHTNYGYYQPHNDISWRKVLDRRYKVSTLDALAKTIVECIDEALGGVPTQTGESGGIAW